MEKYIITENHLKEIIDKCSKSLVGKVMKRFEILKSKEDIKKDTKELIYEAFREAKALIISFSSGIKFISKPRE